MAERGLLGMLLNKVIFMRLLFFLAGIYAAALARAEDTAYPITVDSASAVIPLNTSLTFSGALIKNDGDSPVELLFSKGQAAVSSIIINPRRNLYVCIVEEEKDQRITPMVESEALKIVTADGSVSSLKSEGRLILVVRDGNGVPSGTSQQWNINPASFLRSATPLIFVHFGAIVTLRIP